MQTTETKTTTGCVGKCTSGLSSKELDQITDNINQTLTHPKGRKIFRKYLERQAFHDTLECLDLYEMCCECIEKDRDYVTSAREPDIIGLTFDVERVKEMIEDLDGVPQLDMALLERFNETLNSESRNAMLGVLDDTKDRLRDHLRRVHEHFKRYVSEPCPMTKS